VVADGLTVVDARLRCIQQQQLNAGEEDRTRVVCYTFKINKRPKNPKRTF
jgi:hypothetical protein